MPAADPDYTVLSGYLRNKLRAGECCTITLHKRRVFFAPSAAWGAEIPEILVALDKGASLTITERTVLAPASFVAGGFPLTMASTLSRVFRVLSDKQTTPQRVRKHHGSTDDAAPA